MTPTDAPRQRHRARAILDVAERLVQTRGLQRLQLRRRRRASSASPRPSLHYHFAGKAELGEALIAPLRRALRGRARHASTPSAADAHRASCSAYADLYADVLRDERMCLCGMLAAEYQTLPAPMRDAVVTLLRRQRGLARAGCSTRAATTGRSASTATRTRPRG